MRRDHAHARNTQRCSLHARHAAHPWDHAGPDAVGDPAQQHAILQRAVESLLAGVRHGRPRDALHPFGRVLAARGGVCGCDVAGVRRACSGAQGAAWACQQVLVPLQVLRGCMMTFRTVRLLAEPGGVSRSHSLYVCTRPSSPAAGQPTAYLLQRLPSLSRGASHLGAFRYM